MAIDKALYTAPMGEDENLPAVVDLPAELDSEIVEYDDGSVEVTLGDTPEETDLATIPFDANLAEFLPEETLQQISSDLSELVEADIQSRKEWIETYKKGLEVLGLKYEERTEPWDNACGVYSTLLSEAAIRFQAETMMETFPAAGPVRTKIIGQENKDSLAAAIRVQSDMNHKLLDVMTEYRTEHERMLYSLGLTGSAFKKIYRDNHLQRQVSLFVPAEDVIVPYGAANLETADRVTHMLRKTKIEMERMQAAGFYRDVDLSEPTTTSADDVEETKAEASGYTLTSDDRYRLCEVHTYWRIPGVDEEDGPSRPYVITLEKDSGEVLGIRRNWDEQDDKFLARQHFVHYIYVPGFGFYGLGLIHIIGGYARAGTSLIRQLVDAGTLANLPGGYKTTGMRVKGDDTPIGPGDWKDVDVPSGTLRDNIMPLPYKEPSQTLLALLDRIIVEGRNLGGVNDLKVSDMSAQAPVGTTLALLERALKPMTAVQSRVHYAMKAEFRLLKRLITSYLDVDGESYEYTPEGGMPQAKRTDYEMVEVIPVSDPNSSTMAQRVVQYQAVQQLSASAPYIYDLPYLHRQMIEVLGVPNADKIVPTKDDAEPRDPVSENMGAITGKPLKAFIYQDHEAHLAAHIAFRQDPMIAQMIGQNPVGQQVMGALLAHEAEHLAFLYRKQIEEKLGAPLPPPGQPLPEEVEVLLSRLVADAGRQLTQVHQQQAAQQQAAQQAQDPMYQLQLRKAEAAEAEVARKAAKDVADAQYDREKLNADTMVKIMDILQSAGIQERSMQQDAMQYVIDVLRDQEDKQRQAEQQLTNPQE